MEGTESVGTPAPVASPAPASSGTSDTPRPTFAQAFASDAAASLTADPTTTATPADATVPPAVVSDTPAPGPIPMDRHKAILDGAYKERDALKAQLSDLQTQTGWMHGQEGQQLKAWADQFRTNPEEWFARTAQELVTQRPDLAANLRSHAARILASRQAAAQQAPSFEPDIPVYDDTGRQVNQTFSAGKVQEIVQHAIADALQKEVGPMKSDFEQRQQREEVAATKREAQTVADRQFEDAKQWPGFMTDAAKGTVDPDLAKAFNEHAPKFDQQGNVIDPGWSLERCYIATVVPKLRAQEQAGMLDSLKTKAAASMGVSPSGAVVAATKRPTSFRDPSLKWS